MTVHILLWDLLESQTTLAELRAHLPELPDGDTWISNEVQDRFGLISYGTELPDLTRVIELMGGEPAVAEEFDLE